MMDRAQKAQPSRGEGRRKPSAAERRRRTQLGHRWLRYGIQVAFFVLAPAVFSGAFSAVKYCFAQIAAGEPLEATAFVVLLLAVLGFTIVFGRFFCGYACAFGTLGDVLHDAFEFLRSKTPIPRIVFPAALVKALSLLKSPIRWLPPYTPPTCPLKVRLPLTLSPWMAPPWKPSKRIMTPPATSLPR